mgnify:CR=1 FL=1
MLPIISCGLPLFTFCQFSLYLANLTLRSHT